MQKTWYWYINSSIISHNHCSGNSKTTGPSESTGEYSRKVFQRQMILLTEEVVEQFAAVLVGMEPIVNVGLQTGINMAIVQFSIEN